MQELVIRRSLSVRLSHALDDLVVDVLNVLDALAGHQAILVCQVVLMFLMILLLVLLMLLILLVFLHSRSDFCLSTCC